MATRANQIGAGGGLDAGRAVCALNAGRRGRSRQSAGDRRSTHEWCDVALALLARASLRGDDLIDAVTGC